MKETEASIQRAILEYLAARKIMAHRLNSGTILGESKGRKWAVKMAPKGTADILALPTHFVSGTLRSVWVADPLYIEVKTATGKQSPEQLEFEQEVQEMGFRYIVARSIDDVEAAL